MKKFKLKSMGPKQILAYIAFLIAVVWTLKFIFELTGAGLNQVKSTNNGTTSSPPANRITLNCNYIRGTSIVGGGMMNVPKGFKGTHDLEITLDSTNREIVSFNEMLGVLYAKNTRWSDTQIYWRWIMNDDSSHRAYTDYYLSRTSGELSVLFESNKYPSSSYIYNCDKASQKF